MHFSWLSVCVALLVSQAGGTETETKPAEAAPPSGILSSTSGTDCNAIEAGRLAKDAKAVLDDNWTGQSTKPGKIGKN